MNLLKITLIVTIGLSLWELRNNASLIAENQNLREQLIIQQARYEHEQDMTRTYSNALRYELVRSERLEAILTRNVGAIVTQ